MLACAARIRFRRAIGRDCAQPSSQSSVPSARLKASHPSKQSWISAARACRSHGRRRGRRSGPVPRQNYDRLSNQVHKPGIQFGSFTCKTGLMLRPLRLILVLYSRFFHSRRDLLLENLALRQQLGVLQRRRPQPRFGISDKFFWVILRRLWRGWNRALILIQPETVVRWHRAGQVVLEVALAASDPRGKKVCEQRIARVDPSHGRGESHLGRAAHSR